MGNHYLDDLDHMFAWYQFSREANSEGFRRGYARWPLPGLMEAVGCNVTLKWKKRTREASEMFFYLIKVAS